MHLSFGSLALGAVLACSGSAGATIFPEKVHSQGAPVIDGVGSDPAWQKATEVQVADPIFRSGVDMSRHRTILKFLTDGKTLFVGAECRFPAGDNRLPGLDRKRHQTVFENDSLELFFAPDGGRTATPCYHFAIDLCGDTAERKAGEPWHSGWKTAVSLGKDRWYAEMAIPLAGIGAERTAGHYWHVNACRNIYGASGRFVEGLALARPGYHSPIERMVLGPVAADILAGHVKAALAAMETMRPYLAGPDRALFQRLTDLQNRLEEMRNAPVPTDEAVAILETVARNDRQIVHDVILNFMFESEP